jgi:competence protein ComGC
MENAPKERRWNSVRARVGESGFTLVELMFVIVGFGVLALVLLPSSGGSRARAPRIQCVNNLKQIGLAFRTWALDHNDTYPMQVSMTNGGTLEAISYPFMTFRVISNELSTPKILICPADRQRACATDFQKGFNSFQISYFVGTEALQTNSQMFLSGDRNMTNTAVVRRGLVDFTTNQPAGWTEELHERQGNVGLADGSVQQLSRSKLREALQYTGDPRNRLAIP